MADTLWSKAEGLRIDTDGLRSSTEESIRATPCSFVEFFDMSKNSTERYGRLTEQHGHLTD